MTLLSQTVLPLQLLTGETISPWVTLPVGCQTISVTCNIDPVHFASTRSLSLKGEISMDGAITVLPSDGMQWVGPDLGIVPPSGVAGKFGFTIPCGGFDGAMVRARLIPGAEGILTDLVVEVD